MALYDSVKTLVGGSKLIIRSGAVSKVIRKSIEDSLPDVGQTYLQAIKKNTSLDDHTLEELRQLGHPYARGFIKQAKAKAGFGIHGDDALVHIQSGDLQKSFKLTSVKESERTMSIQVTSDSPYVEALMNGTPTMRPRRFHIKAYKDVKKKLWNPIADGMKKTKYRIEKGTY